MKALADKKNILWDFDGVIIDSHEIREQGFLQILKAYPDNEVALLMDYHRKNGGLSRYVKFRYFFDHIRKEDISEEKMKGYTDQFSDIMRRSLPDKKYLIEDSFQFIKKYAQQYRMHIISGSDGEELRYLCNLLEISRFFVNIEGSPTPKTELVTRLMEEYSYLPKETLLIGDAINDFDAAEDNGIEFLGYNNPELKDLGAGYIESFEE